jgi:hypothetical protein
VPRLERSTHLSRPRQPASSPYRALFRIPLFPSTAERRREGWPTGREPRRPGCTTDPRGRSAGRGLHHPLEDGVEELPGFFGIPVGEQLHRALILSPDPRWSNSLLRREECGWRTSDLWVMRAMYCVTGDQARPINSIRDPRFQTVRLGGVGAGCRWFTDNSRTRPWVFLASRPGSGPPLLQPPQVARRLPPWPGSGEFVGSPAGIEAVLHVARASTAPFAGRKRRLSILCFSLERLSFESSALPRPAVSEHGIQDGEELPHGGGDRDFAGTARGYEAVKERPDLLSR